MDKVNLIKNQNNQDKNYVKILIIVDDLEILLQQAIEKDSYLISII